MAREEVNARVLNDIQEVVWDLSVHSIFLTSMSTVNPPVYRKEGEKRERQRKRNGDLYLNLEKGKKKKGIPKKFFKVDNKIKVLMVVNLYYPVKHVIFLHNSRLVVQSSPSKIVYFP